MREDILELIRSEYRKEKQSNERRKEFRRIFMDPAMYSFINDDHMHLSLLGNCIIRTDDEIISKIYPKYLDMISQDETNGIYLYRGTYDYDFEKEERSDFPIGYFSETAECRAYEDIEYNGLKIVSIEDCREFEDRNIIIHSKDNYYKIQRDFFVEAVKFGQESAKKLVLKKYNKKSM